MPNSLSELHTLHAWEDNQITECCTQGEYAGKVLQFKLIDKDGAINLSNCLVQYAVTRPDKTEDLLDCTVDNGIVKCNLTYSVTSVVGLVHGEVRVIGSNDSGIIKFYGVNLRVYKGVSDEAAEQSDEFTALTAALQKVGVVEPDGSNTVELDETIRQNGTNPVASGLIYDALLLKANIADVYTKTESDTALALKANAAEVYTKTQTNDLLEDKVDYIPFPFMPAEIHKDKYVKGYLNGRIIYDVLEGATAIIIPVKAKKGILSWDAGTSQQPDNRFTQVISLNANFERVSNAGSDQGIVISNGRITLNLSEHPYFKPYDYKYLCFATSNINTVEYNGIFSSDSLYIDAYTKEATDTLLEKKMDDFPLPFMPVRVYKDQYCDGWVNWGDTTYGDPHFSTLAGCTGFILPVKGHKGIMTWKVNTTKTNQVVVLNSNLKRVENKAPAIIGSIASLNLATDPNFKTKSFDYIAFATTDINSITFKEMLSSEGFYINPANTRYEIYNDEPVLAQFNPPYLYSDETPLYIYPQALFNRPFKMVSNPSGHNSLIQNGHNGFNLFNVTDLPTKTKVTIANGKKVLFIGDSYTNHRIYVKYVYDTITALNKEITLLGSWGEGVYRHEGRSGWRNYTFAKCSNQTDDSAFSGGTSIPNPFYNPNPSVKQFDFGFYVTNKLNGVCPDIVFVNLGANDMSRGDYNTESDICEFVNIIVSSIKNYNSNIKVVYWLPNQFPIGINSGYDRWEGTTEYCRIIMNNYIELGIDELCPIRYAFDCYNDGRYVTQNINGHDMILLSDTTHPSDLGYQHIGQMIIPYIH